MRLFKCILKCQNLASQSLDGHVSLSDAEINDPSLTFHHQQTKLGNSLGAQTRPKHTLCTEQKPSQSHYNDRKKFLSSLHWKLDSMDSWLGLMEKVLTDWCPESWAKRNPRFPQELCHCDSWSPPHPVVKSLGPEKLGPSGRCLTIRNTSTTFKDLSCIDIMKWLISAHTKKWSLMTSGGRFTMHRMGTNLWCHLWISHNKHCFFHNEQVHCSWQTTPKSLRLPKTSVNVGSGKMILRSTG